MKGIFFFLLFFIPASVEAGFYESKAEGWHWYEDNLNLPPQNMEPSDPTLNKKEVQLLSPTQELNALKEELEQALHLAVMHPTQKNVRQYMEKQQRMFNRSELFAQRWLEVLFMHPNLDSTIQNPINQAARHLYLDQKQINTENTIRSLSKKYGLFFFFKASCGYCHQFAPIVKRFSEKYGWEVLAISLDGSSLPEFPNARMDNGSARNLNVTILPTLLAVSPSNNHVIPLSFGMNSIDHIEERIRVLVKSGEVK